MSHDDRLGVGLFFGMIPTLGLSLILCFGQFTSNALASESSSSSAAISANPSENQTVAEQKQVIQEESPISPWRIYGGIGTGVGTVSSNDYSNSPNGGQYLLNLDATYQLPRWVFDAGIGWYYSTLSGTYTNGAPISVDTRSALTDISARYRIGEHWQVGPVVNVAFGTDTAFGPSVNSSVASAFVGIKGAYEFLPEVAHLRFPVRFWSQISTDVSISGSQVYLAFVGIQVGIPISVSRKSRPEEPIHVSAAVPAEQYIAEVRIPLDPQKVFFGTNSSVLKPEVNKVLVELGAYLKENPRSAESIEIAGHADQRGRFEYNLRLSKKRSHTVSSAISKGGLDPKKLKVTGHSYSIPIDSKNNPVAWAKNRRVEIILNHVTQADRLKEILNPLMEQNPQVLN